VIVDTSVVIELERGTAPSELGFRPRDEVAIAAVTEAELLVGAASAPTADEAARRLSMLVLVTQEIDVLDYTRTTASRHAELLAFTRRVGRPRGAHDLIIAAHALETGRVVLTRDAQARFGDLPGIYLAG